MAGVGKTAQVATDAMKEQYSFVINRNKELLLQSELERKSTEEGKRLADEANLKAEEARRHLMGTAKNFISLMLNNLLSPKAPLTTEMQEKVSGIAQTACAIVQGAKIEDIWLLVSQLLLNKPEFAVFRGHVRVPEQYNSLLSNSMFAAGSSTPLAASSTTVTPNMH